MAVKYYDGKQWHDVGGMTMELVWTNQDASLDFAAQTVTLLKGYNAYVVVYIQHTGATNVRKSDIIYRDGKRYYSSVMNFSSNTPAKRYCYASDNTITFSQGYNGTTSGSNGYCIPLEIYGINGF